MNEYDINTLCHSGIITNIDFHFARFITNLCERYDPDIFMGAALVSNAAGNGDVYLDLSKVADKPLSETMENESDLQCPELTVWTEKLYSSSVVGKPGEYCPLILDHKNRLYLYRYWDYEKKLSDSIIKRAQENINTVDITLLQDSLKRLFPGISGTGIDWQKVAALTATFKKFCVISGGPGTGKTFTVAKILALLCEQNRRDRLEILLAAPTGKAAARLSETIRNTKKSLECNDDVINAIPSESYTIHRMLKTISGSPYFIHNAKKPLNADVVIVDEASMVDLALMSKLIEAVPDNARLILVGDKDQLASVEAGSVLGDICDRDKDHGFSERFCKRFEEITQEKFGVAGEHNKISSALDDCIVVLKKSFRFDADSAVGKLSRRVNHGDFAKVLELLKTHGQISWQEILNPKALSRALSQEVIKGYSGYLNTADPLKALERFNRFKILCAVNIGPYGVNAINRLAEQILKQEVLINPDQEWYRGRPVLITRNDYNLGLFNGDMGITLPVPGSGNQELYVYFPGVSGDFRRFLPYRLPEHETAFATTVHKSQGSEFDDILLVLPDKDYPVLTRELLYTAITRARHNISIWGTPDIIKTAVLRKIERTSGLRDALWEMLQDSPADNKM